MGIVVEVGALADSDSESAEWFRSDMATINALLAEKGIQPHTEPESLPELHSRCDVIGYPYTSIHYLRRFYARCQSNPGSSPEPVKVDEDPTEDEFYSAEFEKFESHLVCHSDCEGYYLPIDFTEVLTGEEEGDIPGDFVGSSYQLMRELVSIAPKLGIELFGGKMSDEEAARINSEIQEDGDFHIEKMVWLDLFENARLSIEHSTAIMFQ